MQQSEHYHNEVRDCLYETLNNRGHWHSVAKEVPYHKLGDLERLTGQADIITVNEGHAVYWEIKTGYPNNARASLNKQARAWYRTDEVRPNTKKSFVSYNPKNERRPMIGKFRRHHVE